MTMACASATREARVAKHFRRRNLQTLATGIAQPLEVGDRLDFLPEPATHLDRIIRGAMKIRQQ